mgnify:CR=1 FL=1
MGNGRLQIADDPLVVAQARQDVLAFIDEGLRDRFHAAKLGRAGLSVSQYLGASAPKGP